MTFPHHLERSITIQAPRDLVFSFFTDSARWAAWWGAGSTIQPRPGGRVYIRLPGNVEVSGEVLELRAPGEIVFTYGYASGTPFPSGGSRVTVRLDEEGAGTTLHLRHEFAEAEARDHHVQGWRFQLSVFGNAVLNVVHADAAAKVDAWFRAWADPDAASRAATLASVAAPSVQFRDRFSLLDGMDDVLQHITAAQRFMPGIHLERRGDVRHCQGMVLADWAVVTAEGATQGTGTNVFLFAADGRIASATGFWSR